jgi:hypothetical protein
MTEREFRRMALALDGTIESAHMGHPDFRAHGRIFATLHADRKFGMVALTPEQQQRFIESSPAFTPEAGAWGRSGSTRVDLREADDEVVGEALTMAWQNAEAKAKRPAEAGPSVRARPKASATKRKAAGKGKR